MKLRWTRKRSRGTQPATPGEYPARPVPLQRDDELAQSGHMGCGPTGRLRLNNSAKALDRSSAAKGAEDSIAERHRDSVGQADARSVGVERIAVERLEPVRLADERRLDLERDGRSAVRVQQRVRNAIERRHRAQEAAEE